MNKKGLQASIVLSNKLYEQERQLKKERSKTFLEYLDSLPLGKRLRQMETWLYDTHQET
jgi:hypothetical protein